MLSALVACREVPEDPLLATTKLLSELQQHMLDGQYEEVGAQLSECFIVTCTGQRPIFIDHSSVQFFRWTKSRTSSRCNLSRPRTTCQDTARWLYHMTIYQKCNIQDSVTGHTFIRSYTWRAAVSNISAINRCCVLVQASHDEKHPLHQHVTPVCCS